MAGLRIEIDTNAAQRASDELKKRLKALGMSAAENEAEFKRLEDRLHDGMGADRAAAEVEGLRESLHLTRIETARMQASAGDYSGALRTMTGGINLATVGMAAFAAAVVATGAAVVSATKSGVLFESTMKSVQAISRASKEEFTQLSTSAREMGATTEWSASQAGEALKYLAMSGMDTANAIKALPGMLDLATAAQMDLGEASDIVTDSLTAFGMTTGQLSRLTDVFISTSTRSNTTVQMMGEAFKFAAPVAAQLGYNVEETAGLLGTLANSGIKASIAGSDLKSMMLRTSGAAKSLGIEGANLNEVLQTLHDRGASANEVQKLFGLYAVKSALVLMNQGEAVRDLTEALRGSEGIARQTAETMRDGLGNDLKVLASQAEETGLKMFDMFSPSLRELIKNITTTLGNNQEAFKTLGEVVSIAAGAVNWFVDGYNKIDESKFVKAIRTAFAEMENNIAKVKAESAGLDILTFEMPEKSLDIIKNEYLAVLQTLGDGQSDIQEHINQLNEQFAAKKIKDMEDMEERIQSIIDSSLENQIKAKEAALAQYKKYEDARPEIIRAAEAEIQTLLKKSSEAKQKILDDEFKERIKNTDKDLKNFFADIDSLQSEAYDAEQDRLEAAKKAIEEHQEEVEDAQSDMLDTIQGYTSQIISDWDNAGDMLVDIAKRTAAEMAAAFLTQQFIMPVVQAVGSSTGMSWNGIPMANIGGTSGLTLPSGSSLSWLGNNIPGMGGLGSAMSWTLPGTATAGAELGWGARAAADIGMGSAGTTLSTALGYGSMGGLGYQYLGGALGLPVGQYSGLTASLGGALGGAYGGSALSALGISSGSIAGPIGAAIGAILGGIAGSLFDDDPEPKIKMGTRTRGYRSEWGYGVNPDDMGRQGPIAEQTISYFDAYFSALDETMSISLKDVIAKNEWKTVPNADDYESYADMYSAMTNEIFQQLQKPLLESLGLNSADFSENYFTEIAGDGSVAESFASLAVYADQIENFADRVNSQVASGSTGKDAINNMVAIFDVLQEVDSATAIMSSSSSINAIREMVSAQEKYIKALKEASATEEEMAKVQTGIAQQIGASITGITANSLQGILTGGGDITASLQTTVKGAAAQTIAGFAAESIMTEYGNSLNELIGDAFKNINTDGIDSSGLTDAFDIILNEFDWNGLENEAIEAANAIENFKSGLSGVSADFTDSINAILIASGRLTERELFYNSFELKYGVSPSAEHSAEAVSFISIADNTTIQILADFFGVTVTEMLQDIADEATIVSEKFANIMSSQASFIAAMETKAGVYDTNRLLSMGEKYQTNNLSDTNNQIDLLTFAANTGPSEIQTWLDAVGVGVDEFYNDMGFMLDLWTSAADDIAESETALADARSSAYDSIQGLIDQMLGGSLAPVQSMEYFTNKYDSLLSDANNATTAEGITKSVNALVGFTPDFLDFAGTYDGNNYNNTFNSVLGQLSALQAQQADVGVIEPVINNDVTVNVKIGDTELREIMVDVLRNDPEAAKAINRVVV